MYKDTLTAYRGLIGSYPNFMFNVPLNEIEAFTAALQAAGTREQFIDVVDNYGLPRTHPEIWTNFQWFVDYMRRVRPVDAGIYAAHNGSTTYSASTARCNPGSTRPGARVRSSW